MLAGRLENGIATDSIMLTVVKFVTMGVSIVTTMLLSKKFSLTDYGTYSQATLIISMGTSLSILGLTDAANYFYNRTENQENREIYLSTIFAIQIIAGFICATTILVFKTQITQYFDNQDLQYIYIYIAFMPLISNLLAIYQVMFISIGKAKLIALRNLIVSILKLGCIAIACLVTKSVVTIFILLLIIDTLQIAYFIYGFYKYAFIVRIKKTKLNHVIPILSYSIPMACYVLTNALFRDMDKLVIGRLTDTETLAIYSNSANLLPFDVLTVAFATVLIPYITKFVFLEQHEKGQHLFSNYLRFAYITTWMIAFGAIIVAPELISFLYGEKYLPGLWIFIVFIAVDMIRFANISIILSAKGKTKILMIYSISSLAANLVLNILFFRLLGTIGPAISTLLVTFFMNVLLLLHGAKILRTSISRLINFKEMGLFLLELIVVGGIAFGIRLLLKSNNINSLLVLIISYGIYILGIGLLNAKKILYLLKEMNHIKI